jgi:RND superfamily putative drug exporter
VPRAVPRRIAAAPTRNDGSRTGLALLRRRAHGTSRSASDTPDVHPVTMWGGRLSVALDALSLGDTDGPAIERRSPVETTTVLLPTGDRLEIPTGAETLRLKGYLIMSRNSAQDYADFVDLVSCMDIRTAAAVLAGIDGYYCGERSKNQWVATQLVRRLADPHPFDDQETADWPDVKQRCLAVAVAMLEEAR